MGLARSNGDCAGECFSSYGIGGGDAVLAKTKLVRGEFGLAYRVADYFDSPYLLGGTDGVSAMDIARSYRKPITEIIAVLRSLPTVEFRDGKWFRKPA